MAERVTTGAFGATGTGVPKVAVDGRPRGIRQPAGKRVASRGINRRVLAKSSSTSLRVAPLAFDHRRATINLPMRRPTVPPPASASATL